MAINRRDWIQQSLLASSALLLPNLPINFKIEHKLAQEFLRLHWNENPYGPSAKVIEAVKSNVGRANLYWDEENDRLRLKLAQFHNLSSDQFLLTSGSTEILSLLGQYVGLQQGEIITGATSFPTIEMFGERCGAKITYIPMKDAYLDLDKMLTSISKNTKLVFVCNPNNPTSTEISPAALAKFCRAVPKDVLICIDEAYIEFSEGGTASSMVGLVDELPNLVICRTFSKVYGLAGFRMGYAMSNASNIEALAYRYPALGMAPGLLPIIAASTALDDQEFVAHVLAEINKGKKIVYNAFANWGIHHAHSSTNFIYAKANGFVRDVRSRLQSRDILITKWPTMKDHIRISVGKPEWMDQLVMSLNNLRV